MNNKTNLFFYLALTFCLSFVGAKPVVQVIEPSFGTTNKVRRNAVDLLNKYGFQAKSDFAASRATTYAYDHEKRFKLLKNAVSDPKAKVVWALRGGAGMSFIVDDLYKVPKPINPKVVVGYSDITALHLFMLKYWKWPCLHAPVLAYNKENDQKKNGHQTLQSTADILLGKVDEVTYNLQSMGAQPLARIDNTQVVGGNLSIIVSHIGTATELDTRGKLVFLEDIGEPNFRLARMMNQLLRSGALRHCKGIIIGDMGNANLKEILYLVRKRLPQLPIFHTKKLGHGIYNAPLPLASDAVIVKSHEGYSLTISTKMFKVGC